MSNKNLNTEQINIGENEKFPVDCLVIPPKNSFILGDCMDYLKLFPPNFFDLAIVDPPYNLNDKISKGGSSSSKSIVKFHQMYSENNKTWDASPPPPEYWDELFRISKNQIVWGGNYFNLPISRGWIIWDKKRVVKNFSRFELAWTSFDRHIEMINYCNNAGFVLAPNDKPKIHPTQKPVEVYRQILKEFSAAGDLILDTHVGSASSLIACTELGFDYIGFEKDEEYYTMAKSRLGRATRKYELFEAV